MRHPRSLAVAAALAAFLAMPAAHGAMPPQDTVKGAKDHPLLSRFEDARMVGYDRKEFEATWLPAGKRSRSEGGKAMFEKTLALEGRYTRIAYNFPQERSSLEVMRNYEAALDKAGLKTVFACEKKDCGRNFGDYWMSQRLGSNFIKGGSEYWEPFNYGRDKGRYLLAEGARPDGAPVHVAVYVVAPTAGKNGGVYLELVEGKDMDKGKVSASLTAGDMAKSIASEGKVAVYGVLFDTDKADVKPESKDALAQMARLLQQDPRLKVYIVGHTDNQGTLARNLDLSQRRAEAVVKALAAEYKVDPKRLSAKGVASYAPVASNDAEAGREKNRRVELVKQ
jgi:outer membrane protein OmpA-like peptidoglycan-associated protein